MADEIKYQYDALLAGIERMQQGTRTIDGLTGELTNDTKAALANFDAETAVTYGQKSQDLSTALNDMGQHLARTAATTNDTVDNMKNTDRSTAQTFA
ncbi:hypothetical protein MOQ72_08565 [Saccharopolyspora sp. K220]|uniref:hypothetical protein n=1 Tax=Saccharopolyspora soli TaxID=2926618 RepID=UPI001F5AD29F|nr:hypothetical protein [Saccharopolyspora soli]MCI2417474.1 hypothetical protein [Saccharopolyspora soli]